LSGTARASFVQGVLKLAVAMAVEHDVGVGGEARQRQAQARDFAGRRARLQARRHGGTDGCDVAHGIGGQLIADPLSQAVEQVRPIAIEIAAAGQLVSAELRRIHHLRDADRIGHRHDDNLAAHLAGAVGLVEQPCEMVQHEHRRGLIGVQRGLQIGLGTRPRLAVAVDDELADRARAVRQQGNSFDVLWHGPE
jgi:hypothetical protein